MPPPTPRHARRTPRPDAGVARRPHDAATSSHAAPTSPPPCPCRTDAGVARRDWSTASQVTPDAANVPRTAGKMPRPNAGVARCPHVAASAPLPAGSRHCTPHAVSGRRRPKSPLTQQLARPAGPLECAPPALTSATLCYFLFLAAARLYSSSEYCGLRYAGRLKNCPPKKVPEVTVKGVNLVFQEVDGSKYFADSVLHGQTPRLECSARSSEHTTVDSILRDTLAPPSISESKNDHTMTLRSTVTSARNCENDIHERDLDDGGDDIYEDTEARVFTERGTSHGWVMVAKFCTSWSLSMEKARAVQKHCAKWQWKTTWDDVLLARLHTSQFSTD
ncbi:hypothetical protein U9M48_040655 [Paspalum notatum var. saurae]|uniref:Uncharacterized protein n=1 Tax=Paspalum notatum var. saurae TaxID=547442 RepID=A0AAQ3UNX2_PASNO